MTDATTDHGAASQGPLEPPKAKVDAAIASELHREASGE